MEYLLLIPILIFLLSGVAFLIIARYSFFNRIRKFMGFDTPVQPSLFLTSQLWALRVLGIFHIILAMYLVLDLLNPNLGSSVPFIVLILPLLAYAILLMVGLVLYFVGKRVNPKRK